MKKKEVLNRLSIDVLGDDCVFINNKHISFAYQVADTVIKEEFKGMYRYFGGLQCDYEQDSPEFKLLEKWLCEIAESVLKKIKEVS